MMELKKPTEAADALRRYTVAVGTDVTGLAKAADYSLRRRTQALRRRSTGSSAATRRRLRSRSICRC